MGSTLTPSPKVRRLARKPRPPKSELLLCQAEIATLVAKMRGAASGAAVALREFNLRQGQGDQVIIFALQGEWLVGTDAAIQVQRAAVTAKLTARVRKT